MTKLVQGVGFNDNKYPAIVNGIRKDEYVTWIHMLERCTKKHWDRSPTYTGTTCSENFKNYTFFYEWCQEQIGFGNLAENNKKWELDKDLLVRSSKFYSETNCVFIPNRVNSLIVKVDAARGEFPIGVYFNKPSGKYMARCRDIGGKTRCLGYHITPESAFKAYKLFKEYVIKQVANEYKDQLDLRAYEALMEYQVNIYD